jgi:hypothetical protein
MKYLFNINIILENNSNEIINKILDKITDSGIDSLSDKEKWLLQNYGKTEKDYDIEYGIITPNEEKEIYHNESEPNYDDTEEINWQFRNDLLNLCEYNQIYDLKKMQQNYWILSFESDSNVAQDIRQLLFKYHNKIRVQQTKKDYIDLIEIIISDEDGKWLNSRI